MFKELTVDDWKLEIAQGLEFRKKYGIESSWADLEALFYNVHPSSDIGPNIISSTGDAFLSTLTVPNPYILMKATMAGQVDQARIMESLNNELMEELFIPEEIQTAILHAFLWGVGILKIGYDSEWGWDPQYDFGKQEKLGLTLSQFDKKGKRIEFDDRIKPGTPWVRACLPHDIVVPWGTFTEHDARWITHRVIRHIDDVKADVKYENKRDLKPVMSMEDFVKTYQSPLQPYRMGDEHISLGVSGRESEAEPEFCELWEIHDRRTGRIKVIASGHPKALRDEIDYTQTSGLPFVKINFVPTARCFWTTPDAYYLRHSQAELSDIALQAAKQRRLNVLKFLFSEDALEEDALDNMLSANVGAGVRINGGIPLKEAVLPLTPGNLNQMLYADMEFVRRDAREVVGFSRNQAGEYDSSSRRTAMEASIVEKGAMLRMNRRQLIQAMAYQRLFRKLDSLVFEYWTTPRWSEVAGQWIRYIGSDLKGDYKYRIVFSSEPQESLQSRVQRAMMMFQGLANDPSIDQMELRQQLLQAINDPELVNLLGQQTQQGAQNANLPTSVSSMRQGGGGGSSNASVQPPPQVSPVQG